MAYGGLTLLAACYAKDRISVHLRFGNPNQVQRIGDCLTHYWFRPGQTFAVLWWARVSARRQFAAFAVAEALQVGQGGFRLPCVHPAVGVHTFLICRCIGKDRGTVGCADELIRRIQEADIDPCRVPPVYYRFAGQALRVGHVPRRIDREELFTFLKEQSREN